MLALVSVSAVCNSIGAVWCQACLVWWVVSADVGLRCRAAPGGQWAAQSRGAARLTSRPGTAINAAPQKRAERAQPADAADHLVSGTWLRYSVWSLRTMNRAVSSETPIAAPNRA